MTVLDYQSFLASKRTKSADGGITIRDEDIHPSLFPHQVEAVKWAAHRGRSALFLDTGLGKSRIAAQWADAVTRWGRRGSALIICPLSIASQTIDEAAAIDIDITYVRSQDEITGPGIYVTNYEMQHQFIPDEFRAVVLDESSILKNHEGSTRTRLIKRWGETPYRLCCTATPAPNDHTELANHAEFLGYMRRADFLAAYFVHDSDTGWRLKGHAVQPMFEWMSGWAMAARQPSDITDNPDDDLRYILPELRIHGEVIPYTGEPEGQLFATELGGVSGRSRVRRETLDDRVGVAAELLDHDRQAIAWCGLNAEADAITSRVDGASNLTGTMDPDDKVALIEAFKAGDVRVLVTKPSIAGMGLNFQNARQQVFVGIGDSYESYYQAIRRSWRFGQTEAVDVHIVVSNLEEQIIQNVRRKEHAAIAMSEHLVRALKDRRNQ